jgi:hypothetical protein
VKCVGYRSVKLKSFGILSLLSENVDRKDSPTFLFSRIFSCGKGKSLSHSWKTIDRFTTGRIVVSYYWIRTRLGMKDQHIDRAQLFESQLQ